MIYRQSRRCLPVLLLAAAGLALVPAATVRAEPQVMAMMDRKEQGREILGELRFDLSGGPVTGKVSITTPTHPDSPLRRTDGSTAAGRFEILVALEGQYVGGSFGTLGGTAALSGKFVGKDGGEAKVESTGTFAGSVTGPSGLVDAQCTWKEVKLDGLGLASPQPLSTELNFAFKPTSAVPVLAKRPDLAGLPGPTPLAPHGAGGNPLLLEPAARSADPGQAGSGGTTVYWLVGAAVVLAAAGIGVWRLVARKK
jgi:hypothetical protein